MLTLPPAQTLEKLLEAIGRCKDPQESWMLQWWASDALVVAGEYARALELYPEPSTGRAVLQTEKLLNLKLVCGEPFTGADVLSLLGPKITAFGRKNIDLVKNAANVIVDEESSTDRIRRMQTWADATWRSEYPVYNGSPAGYEAGKKVQISAYVFVNSEPCVQYCHDISRRAENMVREDAGLPNVGEGWVSETKLFRELQAAFPSLEVVQHASPSWLGRQHLDVYFPSLQVGVEYQGLQHDRPVEFFGGEEAFKKIKQRDAKKLKVCIENNVSLVYVRPGYDLDNVVSQIEDAFAKNRAAIGG